MISLRTVNKVCPLALKARFKSSFAGDSLRELLLTMPKEKPHTGLLKAHRTQLKEQHKKFSPGRAALHVLGSGARGAPRSLYLFTDQSRYLFNCSEGTQRLAHEHKMKLSKLEHIFVTHLSWDNLGGLPGISLTIQDVGVPEITLHGPDGIDEIFSATRQFIVLRDLTMHMADCSKDNYFEDNAITIHYVPLIAKNSGSATTSENNGINENYFMKEIEEVKDDVDYYAHEWKEKKTPPLKKRKISIQTTPPREIRPKNGNKVVCMSYVCRLKEKPGSLCIEKCVERGVPPGPLLGQLKAGRDVTLRDGTLVKSSEVTSPPDPGPVFIVVECPTEEYLESLESEEAFVKHYYSATNEENHAYLVVHFTPPKIMEHPKYRGWMEKFGLSTHHLVMNESMNCLGSLAVHRIQYKLNLLEPKIFPLLRGDGIDVNHFANNVVLKENNEQSSLGNEKDLISSLSEQFSVIPGHTFSSFNLRPKMFIDSSPRLKLEPEEYIAEVEKMEGWKEELEKLYSKIKELQAETLEDKESDPYPSLTFLGTGSCIPNKTRNTSAILLNISKDKTALMDCGEGTWGQMVRFYGREESLEVLKKLGCVYVSHLHADHHLGLVGVLRARIKHLAHRPPLVLLAPLQIAKWLKLYNTDFEPILEGVRLIPNQLMLYDGYKLNSEAEEVVLNSLGVKQVKTAKVKHCPNSFGVALTLSSGWKITYSGDTMPCQSLVELGKDSDILIHEATMEDDLLEEAEIKMHSTTSQAIEAGRLMGAKFTLLTHFSQRYAKLPRIQPETFESSKVGIAFDNMTVKMCDLPKLRLLYPALKVMFQEDWEEQEQKALKRQYKQERNKLQPPAVAVPAS